MNVQDVIDQLTNYMKRMGPDAQVAVRFDGKWKVKFRSIDHIGLSELNADDFVKDENDRVVSGDTITICFEPEV